MPGRYLTMSMVLVAAKAQGNWGTTSAWITYDTHGKLKVIQHKAVHPADSRRQQAQPGGGWLLLAT